MDIVEDESRKISRQRAIQFLSEEFQTPDQLDRVFKIFGIKS